MNLGNQGSYCHKANSKHKLYEDLSASASAAYITSYRQVLSGLSIWQEPHPVYLLLEQPRPNADLFGACLGFKGSRRP